MTFSDSDQQQYHYKLLQIAVILLLVIIKLFVPFLTEVVPHHTCGAMKPFCSSHALYVDSRLNVHNHD